MNRRDLILSGTTVAAASAFSAATAADTPAPRVRARRAIVARDGTRLHHVDMGEGPTLLFIASWALHSGMWDYQVAHFVNQGFRCVALDRRGHGRSDIASGGYDMDTLADDVAMLIETLDLRDVVLVAHSMGAAEAIRYMARHAGRRIRAIVLLAPVAPFILATADNLYGAPQAVFNATEQRYAADFPAWAYDNQPGFFTASTSEPLKEHLTQMLLQVPVPVAIACFRALYRTDLRGDLAAIRVPTLILHGAKDIQAPLAITGGRLALGIANSRIEVLPDAGHGLWVTHLDRVNAGILAIARGAG